jgi:nitroreductase
MDAEAFVDLARRRRSVRDFEPGRRVSREDLLILCEAGRWAPSGANTQPWHFVVVDDPAMIARVTATFVRQSQRLYRYVPKFPHVHKKYLANTVAIIVVCADPRYQIAYPQSRASAALRREYAENSYRIWLASVGAAVQNIQLAVAAAGLTSAWLSGGGEDHTAAALRRLLKIPRPLVPLATVPIGAPRRQPESRWRASLDTLVSWNQFDRAKAKTDREIRFYVDELRAHAMYRGSESMEAWPDYARVADKLSALARRRAVRRSARTGSAPA